MSISLSPDQETARWAILNALRDGARESVLSGPAGSGKTTLMRQLIADIRDTGANVRLMAPTGKAAARLRDLTGETTSTIHSPLYRSVTETDAGVQFADPRAVAGYGDVVICDEASMVGRELHRDLTGALGRSVRILWVGDREQLPPVGDTWGADFTNPTALLTQIHRQAAGSPIIQLATRIRTGGAWRGSPSGDGRLAIVRASLFDAVEWLTLQRAIGEDATLLTFANKTRKTLNGAVRSVRGLGPALLTVGDLVVCTMNQHNVGLMNGEVREVAAAELCKDGAAGGAWCVEFTDGSDCYLLPDTLGGVDNAGWRERTAALPDHIFKRLMRAEYGECLTIHKSQGSQWRHVGIVHDSAMSWRERESPEDYRRLMYTAVTRAAETLTVFEV